MHFERDEIHSVLWQATDALNNRWMASKHTPEDLVVMPKHQSQWFKTYGAGILKSISIPGVLSLLSFIAVLALGKPYSKIAAGVMMFAFTWVAFELVKFCVRNNRQVTAEELGTLLPALQLTGIPLAYTETVVEVGRANHLSREEKSEILKGLCRVMDEHERIKQAQGRFGQPDGTLEEERQKIESKLEGATDPEARRTYQDSLAVLNHRIAQQSGQTNSLERLEAEETLLKQSILRLRDSLAMPVSPTQMGDLRSNLALIQNRSDEVERAVAELDLKS